MTSDPIRIKKTKSVEMYYDEDSKTVSIICILVSSEGVKYIENINIPISKVFQLKRGLESAVQRFYRRKKK